MNQLRTVEIFKNTLNHETKKYGQVYSYTGKFHEFSRGAYGEPVGIIEKEDGRIEQEWIGHMKFTKPLNSKVSVPVSGLKVRELLSGCHKFKAMWGGSNSEFNCIDDNFLHLCSFAEIEALAVDDLNDGDEITLAEYVVSKDPNDADYDPAEYAKEVTLTPEGLYIIYSEDREFIVKSGALVEVTE